MFRLIVLYCYFIVALISFVSLFLVDLKYDCLITEIACFFSFFIVVLYFLNKVFSKDNNWLDPNLLFVIGYLIVFVQVPFKIVQDIAVTEVKFGTNFMNYEYVTFGVLLSLAGLASYLLGSELYSVIFREQIKEKNKIFMKTKNIHIMLNIFLVLSMFSFFVFVLLTSGKDYGESIGFAAELSYSLTNMFSIILFSTSGYLASMNCGMSFRKYILSQHKIVLFYFFVLFLYFMNIGTRAAFITWIITILTPYFCFVRRLSLRFFLVSVVFGMLLVAWSAAFRTNEDIPIIEKLDNSVHVIENMNKLSDDFSGSMYFALTYELEKSYLSYNELLRVTDINGVEYGKGWLIQLISAVFPLVGNVITILFSISKESLASSLALSNLVSDDNYGKGMGSSVIGDIYFNYGRFGVIICMFLFGCFVSFIKVKVFSEMNSLFKLMFLSIYSYLIFNSFLICRNEFYLGWTIYVRIFIAFIVLNGVFRTFCNYGNKPRCCCD